MKIDELKAKVNEAGLILGNGDSSPLPQDKGIIRPMCWSCTTCSSGCTGTSCSQSCSSCASQA